MSAKLASERALSGAIELSIEEYHESSSRGSTDVKNMLRSPAHFLESKRSPVQPTPAMKLGTATHDAILQPELFATKYVATPNIDKRTKAGKEEYEAFCIAHHNKELLSADQFEAIQGMIKSVYAHPTASKLLSQGHAEKSYFWTDKRTGVSCKCRPDFLRDGKIIIDIKTTDDASPDAFSKTIANFGYHISAPWYLDGVSAVTGDKYDTFVFVAVERNPPYAVAVYYLDDSAISFGRIKAEMALDLFRDCAATGIYPGYDEHVQTIDIPAWSRK